MQYNIQLSLYSIYCVLGMHRSGTSCLAGILKGSGLEFGEVVNSAPHNLRGNQENLEIRNLNDAVLLESNGAWNNPPAKISWDSNHLKIREKILEKFRKIDGSQCGFKDPRTVLTLPFWRENLSDYKINLVGTIRHPLAVASSLYARDRIPMDKGINLWLKYNSIILREWRKTPFPIVRFDQSASDYLNSVDNLLIKLKFRNNGLDFFTPELVHQSAASEENLPKDVNNVWTELLKVSSV